MSLTELVDGVETHQRTLTAFNTDEASVESLRDRFAAHNVEVEREESPDVPEAYAVLGEAEEFVTAARVPDLLDPPEPMGPIAGALDRTTLATFDPSELDDAVWNVAERAREVGTGRLHVGVQTLEDLADGLDTYEKLARRSGVHVDAYAAATGSVPDHNDALAVHVERAAEILSTRFVAFDGGGSDDHKRALVAEERESGEFQGFRTADPDTVDYVRSYLTDTYPLVPA